MTHSPTDVDGIPAVCYCCGSEATGIGVGATRTNKDPRWLCEECIAVGPELYVAAKRSLSAHEKAAVARAVNAVGPFIEANGSDLAEWPEEVAIAFVAAIWQACGNELRNVIKEGLGPW